jgi:glycosyltransferase involved in cell wall biosynthesis
MSVVTAGQPEVARRGDRKPRVVYWFDIPTPTPIERCNAVAALGALDFEVWFSRRTHDQGWQVWAVDEGNYEFPFRYVAPRRVLGRAIPIPLDDLRRARPDVIVHDYWPWYLGLGVLGSKAFAQRTALRVLPTFDPLGQRTRFGHLSMNFIFRAVDGAKVSGPDGAAYAARYGLPIERTARVTQTIDTGRFARAAEMPAGERAELRQRLGLTGCAFLCVGRLWSGKGLDYLLEAYRQVAAVTPDVSLLLVGDGPEEAKYRALAAELPNVVFTGWIPEAGLPEYFGACDVVVFPTLGDPHGLVVEEAMATRKPVISTELAGDIRLRLEGRGGFVVPGRDAHALAQRMSQLASDEGLRRRLGEQAFAAAASVEHARYATDFVAFVEKMLALPPRQTRAARQAGVIATALRRWS